MAANSDSFRETLSSWGLSAYADKIIEEGFTSVQDLVLLTDEDIKSELGITKLADRRKLTSRLSELAAQPRSPSPTTAASDAASSSSGKPPAAPEPHHEEAEAPFRDPFTLPSTRDLIDRLRRREVILLVGSGFSIASTFRAGESPPFPTALSWPGLLRQGVEYAVQLKPASEARVWRDAITAQIDGGDLIGAATALCSFLQREVDAKHFAYFLRDAFDTIAPRNTELTAAFRRLVEASGSMVTTTNYDHLLEQQLALPALHYSDHPELLDEWIRGRARKVFHWHGSYQRAADVILDTTHYHRIVSEHRHVQAAMGACAVTKTFLFLGCGSGGLSDPSWGKLMARLHDIGLSDRYALCTAGELSSFAQLKGLVAIPYGRSFGDLLPFLVRLASEVDGTAPGALAAVSIASLDHTAVFARGASFREIGGDQPDSFAVGADSSLMVNGSRAEPVVMNSLGFYTGPTSEGVYRYFVWDTSITSYRLLRWIAGGAWSTAPLIRASASRSAVDPLRQLGTYQWMGEGTGYAGQITVNDDQMLWRSDDTHQTYPYDIIWVNPGCFVHGQTATEDWYYFFDADTKGYTAIKVKRSLVRMCQPQS